MAPANQVHKQEDEKEENAADWHDVRCGRLFTLLLLLTVLPKGATSITRLRLSNRAL